MMRYVSGFLAVAALLLLYTSMHFCALSNQQQSKIKDQQKTITQDEQANQSLMTTASILNARNNTLVESLNDRSQQLAQQRARADATRRAYQQAIAANHSWASEHVPESVARVLYASTHASVPNNPAAKDSGAR